MRFNTLGFTLAELLVVVSILSIVSFFSVGTYYQMEQSSSIEKAKSQIQEIFRGLDDEIKNGKITSYSASFKQNQRGVMVEIDTYGYDAMISIDSFNWATGTGLVLGNYTSSGVGFRVFNSTSIRQQGNLGTTKKSEFSIEPFNDSSWEVRGLTTEIEGNGFRPVYFENEYSIPDSQRVFFLGFSGSTQTGGIVSNIRGKKSHTASGTVSEIFPIELIFEKKGVPFSIFLK